MTRSGRCFDQLGVAQPQAVHHPGAEVLDHHVALGDEAPGQLDAARLLEVYRDAAVPGPTGVLAEAAVAAALAPGEGRQGAGHVDPGFRLDLVDLGTEEGQRLADHRPGPHPAEVGDPDAL